LKEGDAENQLEAAWSLTNIATGTHEQSRHVLAAAPILIQLLSSANIAMQEQGSCSLFVSHFYWL